MGIRVLMRGGIYLLFIIGAVVGWFLKRRQRTNVAQPVVSNDSDSDVRDATVETVVTFGNQPCPRWGQYCMKAG